MTSIPTVRVEHPVGAGYMTINVTDLKPHHRVWHTQGEGYDPKHARKQLEKPLDPALRDVAAATMLRYAAMRYLVGSGGRFSDLTAAEQVDYIRSMSEELTDQEQEAERFASKRVARDREDREKLELDSAALQAVSEQPPAPEPTPRPEGLKVETEEAETDEAETETETDEDETDEDQGTGQDDPSVSGDTQGDYPGASDDQDNTDRPGQATEVATSAGMDVERSPRGKFYVRRAGRRVSRGFNTQDEADQAKSRMEVAS